MDINGKIPIIGEKIEQKIPAGAVVRLDDAVVKFGVIFIHPELPLLRLLFNMDPEGKKLPQYIINPIIPEHGPDKTHFSIELYGVEQANDPALAEEKPR